ncbi:hypothetical protein [Rhodomicrobium lacus]|uniref:hypothetical protein n=1 Tax=Rhodomicrobium lacus TaxID=2498452 RepID=UPI000F8D3912|nr:hypothetical protein [Rhodomicrobium lacus]
MTIKTIAGAALVAATLALPVQSASAAPLSSSAAVLTQAAAQSGVEKVHWRGHRGYYGHRRWGHRHWGGPRGPFFAPFAYGYYPRYRPYRYGYYPRHRYYRYGYYGYPRYYRSGYYGGWGAPYYGYGGYGWGRPGLSIGFGF